MVDTPAQLADCEARVAEMRRYAASAGPPASPPADSSVGPPADPDLNWLLIAAEAAASSAIEDIFASPRALLRAAFSGSGTRSATQTMAAVAATRKALEIGEQPSPVSVDDILAIHAALTTDLPGYTYAPGAVREHQVTVGGFVPPPHDRLAPLLDDLAAFCARTDIEPLTHGAIAHARFEEIHPFPDGNGRTGRALVHTLWAKHGLITRHSVVPFSVGLARRQTNYYAALAAFQTEAAPLGTPWALTPVLDAFITAAATALERTAALRQRLREVTANWRDTLTARLHPPDDALPDPPQRDLLSQLLTHMPSHPVVDATLVVERYGVGEAAARAALAQLEHAGILHTRRVAKHARAHEAPEVVQAFIDSFSDCVRFSYGV